MEYVRILAATTMEAVDSALKPASPSTTRRSGPGPAQGARSPGADSVPDLKIHRLLVSLAAAGVCA